MEAGEPDDPSGDPGDDPTRGGADSSTGPSEATVLRAIASAGVGREVLYSDLAAIGAIEVEVGSVRPDDGDVVGVRVTITLPTPSRDIAARLERDVEAAVAAIEGVAAVEVRSAPDVPRFHGQVDFIPGVRNVIAVASGKGGVGKSTVAANLAAALADAGAAVGLLDADVYGPNAPAMLGLSTAKPATTADDRMIPREAHGIKAMSMGMLVGDDDPVIWRGVLVDEMIQQLFADVAWGQLDYLIVDLPPGTGDAHLSLVQHLPVTGAIVVTTPDEVAVDDAMRSLEAFATNGVAILGIVENMGVFACPDCGGQHRIFDEGGADTLAELFELPVLARIPIDPAVGELEDDAEDVRGEPPGLTIPGIGRLGLPRTREEREGRAGVKRRPPVVLREETSPAAAAFRAMATRTAARVNSLIHEVDIDHDHDDDHEHAHDHDHEHDDGNGHGHHHGH